MGVSSPSRGGKERLSPSGRSNPPARGAKGFRSPSPKRGRPKLLSPSLANGGLGVHSLRSLGGPRSEDLSSRRGRSEKSLDDLRRRHLLVSADSKIRQNPLLFDLLAEPYRKIQTLFDHWKKKVEDGNLRKGEELLRNLEVRPGLADLDPFENRLFLGMEPYFLELILFFSPKRRRSSL